MYCCFPSEEFLDSHILFCIGLSPGTERAITFQAFVREGNRAVDDVFEWLIMEVEKWAHLP